MDERRLKCFIAVYEQGSVSAAAKRLHMTQPPLSILLRKLEDELGVTLFDRSTHRLAPTTTGDLFYLRAKTMLANLDSMRRELREAEQGARGTVHIGCATAASLFVMPSLMADLLAHELNITIHVHEGESSYSLQRLRERGLDLVISRSEYIAQELETRIILDEPLQVMLPPGHPKATNDRVSLKDLRDDRFLLHRSPLGTGISDLVLRACQQAGFIPNVVYWGGETLPMLLMAQRGMGVAFAPQSFAQLGAPDLLRLRSLDECLRTHLNVAWPRAPGLTPVASRIRDLILARFAPA